jgi:acyl dehydratase
MFKLGDRAEISKRIEERDVHAFADTVGDHNPLHLDAAFASTTRFGKPIAHGFLAASLISAVLGNKLPGKGTIYLSQTLQFRAPVYIGDTVTASVLIVDVRTDKPIITLDTKCTNQKGDLLITGQAVVLLEIAGLH